MTNVLVLLLMAHCGLGIFRNFFWIHEKKKDNFLKFSKLLHIADHTCIMLVPNTLWSMDTQFIAEASENCNFYALSKHGFM